MKIEKGYKLCLSKEKGKTKIEITRHKNPVMDNFLIINSIGSTRYEDTWIIEKDLERTEAIFYSNLFYDESGLFLIYSGILFKITFNILLFLLVDYIDLDSK